MLYAVFVFGFVYGTEGFKIGVGGTFLLPLFFTIAVFILTGQKKRRLWLLVLLNTAHDIGNQKPSLVTFIAPYRISLFLRNIRRRFRYIPIFHIITDLPVNCHAVSRHPAKRFQNAMMIEQMEGKYEIFVENEGFRLYRLKDGTM